MNEADKIVWDMIRDVLPKGFGCNPPDRRKAPSGYLAEPHCVFSIWNADDTDNPQYYGTLVFTDSHMDKLLKDELKSFISGAVHEIINSKDAK